MHEAAADKWQAGPKMYLATADKVVSGDQRACTPVRDFDVPHADADHNTTTQGSAYTRGAAGVANDVSPEAPIIDDLADFPEDKATCDRERQGSTKLHMDMSGAVNIMVSDLSGKGSLWTIFAAKDTEIIRGYLRKKYNLDPSSPCPIHSQRYYLHQADLRKLLSDEAVIPYIFTQRKGQAVFIPVGCVHQVSVPSLEQRGFLYVGYIGQQ